MKHTENDNLPGGVLAVHKGEGMTSHDVVGRVRKLYNTKRVGHTGTLDPLATGVLVVLIGRAAKAAEYLTYDSKTYRATLRLGITTDTEDITGNVLTEREAAVTEEELEAALTRFRGEIDQIPPMYSALKVGGQKLCDLARKGREVERQPRTITIHKLECLEFTGDTARLLVHCSKGTYIRTLCKDIGEALGCGGCMAALRRVQAGEYTIDEAVPLPTLLDSEDPGQYLRPVDSMFRNYPEIALTEKQTLRCRNGNAFSLQLDDGTYRAYSQSGEFLMLAKVENGVMSTIKSFFEV